MRRYLYILLIYLTFTYNLYAQVYTDTSVYDLKYRAYQLLKENPAEAESLFIYISKINPADIVIKRQLGYLNFERKNYLEALRYFTESQNLSYSDTIALQIAYCLLSLNTKGEAEKILKQSLTSEDPLIKSSSKRQLSELKGRENNSHWWTGVYAVSYYDTRWETFFYYADFKQGYKIDKDGILSGYGFLNLSGDSRSVGGLAPEIFSDNAAIIGLGLNFRPFHGFQFNNQYGASYDFIKRDGKKRINHDFRSIMIYGNGIYPNLNLHSDLRMPFYIFADFYSSAGYYSRYKNFIGYLQGRFGSRIFEINNAVSDIYIKGSLVLDTEKEFYNNQFEGLIGLRIMPDIEWGLVFAIEAGRGFYINMNNSENPYDTYFNSIRFFVIFDRIF